MLRDRTYFVDSGIWLAHFDRRDQWHGLVESILRELAEFGVSLISTDVVILEFITLTRKRFSVDVIDQWVQSILDTVEIVCTVSDDLETARRIITKYLSIPFSGFDASSVAVMERLSILRALTVDDEFIRCSKFVDVRPNISERRTILT